MRGGRGGGWWGEGVGIGRGRERRRMPWWLVEERESKRERECVRE